MMKRVIALFLVVSSIGSACSDGSEAITGGAATPPGSSGPSDTTAVFPPGTRGTGPGPVRPGGAVPGGSDRGFDGQLPEIDLSVDAPRPTGLEGDLPVFFFLFTHTEDPFNHELSEERYTRLVPVVEDVAAEFPEAQVHWTIMFQGSDARTVAERNVTTGVADLLRAAEATGVIEFGYHAHHDPTYDNRPQNDFAADSSWEALVSGMAEWISCRTDLLRGGCEEPGAGGLLAIEDLLGDVAIASGLFVWDYLETGAGVHAYRRYDPERILGYGFPDHGPITSSGAWSDVLPGLLEMLAPAWDTSPSLIWMDDIIRINSGVPAEGVTGIDTLSGPRKASATLDLVSRDRISLFNPGFASKYVYTATGTSPTIYGYSHPDSPELPPEYVLSEVEIEAAYASSEQTLRYLAGEFIPANPGSRFIDTTWIIDHIAPADYFSVGRDQIVRMADWVLDHWAGAPPAWVYDGLDYFSIRDALVLMAMAVADPGTNEFELLPAYGPLQDAGSRAADRVSTAVLESMAADISASVMAAAVEPWTLTPRNLLPTEYGDASLSTAQVLYGLAQLVVAGDATADTVDLVATEASPVSLTYFEALDCPTCFDTVWSLKPARIRLDG